jgi:hypothetical protein
VAALVYRYRISPLGSAAARRAVTDNPKLISQLWLAHRLRNDLVEIEHGYQGGLELMWALHPTVGEPDKELDLAKKDLNTLVTEAKIQHSADRSTRTRPKTAEEIAKARLRVATAKAARKEAIKQAYPMAEPEIEKLGAERDARTKALYADYVQGRGLHWATYNGVVQHHRTAVNRVKAARKAGHPAQLRYHRWDGQGTLRVQLQRATGGPLRSPAVIASGTGKWRNLLRIGSSEGTVEAWDQMTRAERKRAGRGYANWYIGGGESVALPVQMHCPLPPDADIAMAQLTRRVIAGVAQWHITLTVKVPDPTPVEGPSAALHMGWRKLDDGAVRVATWATQQPVTVPDHLHEVVRLHDSGRSGEIVFPSGWLDVAGRPASLRSIRDTSQAPVQDTLAAWLDEYPQPDPRQDDPDRQLTGARVRRWRSASRLAALCHRWREQPPAEPGGHEQAVLLEEWRKQDKHLWAWEANERDQNVARRNDAWRKVASWLTNHAGSIVVDDTNLAKLRRRDDVADNDPALPAEQANAARARAALAAPGYLRAAVCATAARRGVATIIVPAKHLSCTHRVCGHIAKAHPRYAASRTVECPGCGQPYDQDHNAALLMLDRAATPTAAG